MFSIENEVPMVQHKYLLGSDMKFRSCWSPPNPAAAIGIVVSGEAECVVGWVDKFDLPVRVSIRCIKLIFAPDLGQS